MNEEQLAILALMDDGMPEDVARKTANGPYVDRAKLAEAGKLLYDQKVKERTDALLLQTDAGVASHVEKVGEEWEKAKAARDRKARLSRLYLEAQGFPYADDLSDDDAIAEAHKIDRDKFLADDLAANLAASGPIDPEDN